MTTKSSVYKLCAFLFFFHATGTLIISYLPTYLEEFRALSGTQIGFIMAIGPFASLISQPFWGYLSDKYKTVKWILMICISGMFFFSLFLFQMSTFLSLSVAAVFFFSLMAPVGALGDSLAQKTADRIHVPFGRIRMWGSIGFATTALLAGQVLTDNIENLFYVYLFYGIVAVVMCIFISDVKVTNTPVTVIDALKIGKSPKMLVFLLVIVCITISHRANDSFLGLYIMELGGTEQMIGYAWFLAVATEAVVFATSAFWFRRFHPLTFIAVAGLLYSIRWLLFGYISTPGMIIALQFIHGLNFGLLYLCAFQYVTRLVPEHLQATGQLLLISVMFGFSGIVGSVVGGAIFEHAGGSALYYGMGLFALIGTIAVFSYKVYVTRKEKQQSALS